MKSITSMPSGRPARNRPIQPSQASARSTMPAVTAQTPRRDGSTLSDRAATTAAAELAKKNADASGTIRLAVGSTNSEATCAPERKL